MYLKRGDEAYLRLHHGYSIPTANAKFGQQYVGPFKVLHRVGKQAYLLDILGHWRVHPVFSLAQLKPSPGQDPFWRPMPDHPSLVFVKGDTEEFKSYIIERLLNKRVRPQGKGQTVEYLVRCQGYGPEFDTWYNVKYLENAMDMVQECKNNITPLPPLPTKAPQLMDHPFPDVIAAPHDALPKASIPTRATSPKPTAEHVVAVRLPPPTTFARPMSTKPSPGPLAITDTSTTSAMQATPTPAPPQNQCLLL